MVERSHKVGGIAAETKVFALLVVSGARAISLDVEETMDVVEGFLVACSQSSNRFCCCGLVVTCDVCRISMVWHGVEPTEF